MLEQLQRYEPDQKVQWLTARDEHVYPLCAAREGKIFSIDEAKKEIEGKFCKPGDPDDRCRCCFISVIELDDISDEELAELGIEIEIE